MADPFFHALNPVVAAHLGHTFTACAACVVWRGEVRLDHAWGTIGADAHTATPATLFDLASLTKLFTATAFLRVVSAGRVGLDDPLASVLPEFGATGPRPIDGGQDPHTKQPAPVDSRYAGQLADPARVTFRHLLTHTSGLPPWRDVFNAAGPPPPPPDQPDERTVAERWAAAFPVLIRYPFVGQPGDGLVRYSDVGLMLLGAAVMRLTGADTPSDAIDRGAAIVYNPVRDHGRPLSGIAPTEIDATWRHRRAWGEVHDENAAGLGGVAGHAGLFGTARAVAEFGERWRTGAVPGLSDDVRRAAISQQVDDGETRRGLGFALRARQNAMVGNRASLATFGHSGFTGTTLWIDPEGEWVVSLLTNRVYFGRDHDGPAGGITPFRQAAHEAISAAVQP